MSSVLRRLLITGTVLGSSAAYAEVPRLRISDETWKKLSSQAKRQVVKTPKLGQTTTNKPPATVKSWFNDNVFDRLDIAGNRSLAYHAYTVNGDKDAFASTTYYGNGGDRFTDTGTMNVSGRKVLGMLDFQLQFTDNRLHDPDATKTTLNYDRGPIKVSLGDIRGSLLNTNRYARFNRQLKGVMAGYQSGRLELKGLRSETKSAARTVSFQGTNSAGPYYLQSGRIISDSVEVQVDGQPMKLVQDFVVNSEIGAITFVSRVVPPTSTIVASYEANGYNNSTGTIQGAGASYDFGKVGRIALTTMEQVKGGQAGNSFIDDPWEGQGAPSQAYTLAYEPLAGSVTVRIDGILQTEGVDFIFDSLVKSKLYITRYVPSSSTVLIRYRPTTQTVIDGDRRVTGLDYRMPFGKQGRQGYLQYSIARGELFNTDNPRAGTAQGWDGQMKSGPFTFRGSVRDIPRNYVSIETQGFSRNERATDLGVTYNAGRWEYDFTNKNSSVATTSSTNATTNSTARVTNSSTYVHFEGNQGTEYQLEHDRSFSRQTNETRLDTTSLRMNRRFGRFLAGLGVEQQNGRGPISDGTTTAVSNLQLQTVRTNATVDVGGGFGLSTRASVSQIEARGKKGTGTDVTLNASYRPNERLTFNTGVTQSNSGQLASLGSFANGSGYGYGGNGFSGGSIDSSFTGVGGNDVRQYQFSTTYLLNDRINLDGHWYDTTTEGSASSNSNTRAFGFGFNWDLGLFHLLSMTLDKTATRFLGTAGSRSDSTIVSTSFSGSPKGRWSYRLGFSGSLSAGNSAYDQDTSLYETSLSYKIASRQRATVAYYSSRTTGYYGQNDNSLSFLYNYQIYRNIGLVGSYRTRRVINLDPSLTTGSYRSAGFDLELSFDFAQ
jgi:hypothetical protein